MLRTAQRLFASDSCYRHAASPESTAQGWQQHEISQLPGVRLLVFQASLLSQRMSSRSPQMARHGFMENMLLTTAQLEVRELVSQRMAGPKHSVRIMKHVPAGQKVQHACHRGAWAREASSSPSACFALRRLSNTRRSSTSSTRSQQ